MPGRRVVDHTEETEFGGGAGMIDATRRADRVLQDHEQLWEIYATNPSDPNSDPATAVIERPSSD